MCTADPPYATFSCTQTLDGVRLDGPVAFADADHQFVIAPRNIIDPACKKRTALFELTEDAAVRDRRPRRLPVGRRHGVSPRVLVSYQSSNLIVDPSWETVMILAVGHLAGDDRSRPVGV